MSKQVSRKFLIRFTLVLGFVAGCMLGAGGAGFILLQGESPDQAYERGRIQGYLQGAFQVTEIVDEQFDSNLIEAWERDVRECLGDSIVDEFLAGMVDSTDTLPVDSMDTLEAREE